MLFRNKYFAKIDEFTNLYNAIRFIMIESDWGGGYSVLYQIKLNWFKDLNINAALDMIGETCHVFY